MKRWWVPAAVVLLFGVVAATAAGAEWREVGVQVELTLQPLYANGAAHWNFDLGGYALVFLNEGWSLRASAGFDVLNVGPYASLAALRTVVDNVFLEGAVTFQWSFRSSTPTATAGAGIRFMGASSASARSQLAIFPASWTLSSISGAPLAFSFSPSFTVDGAIVLETGLLFGEAATVTFHRVPSLSVQAVWPIGGGWMLSTRLTTHLGFDVPETP